MALATKDTAEEIAASVNSTPSFQFQLSDDQIGSLKSKRGRAAQDSIFLENVRWANEHRGEYAGVKINGEPAGAKVKWSSNFVEGQLRKAAKQLNIKSSEITVYPRPSAVSDDFPDGFVAFIVEDAKPENAVPAAEGTPLAASA